MAKTYTDPQWLDTGSIDLRPSQEGILGIVTNEAFRDWWISADVQENLKSAYASLTLDEILALPGFDQNDPSTWWDLLE